MGLSFQDSERRLIQISVDLLNQMAEIQKLRVAIQSAEASKRRNGEALRRETESKAAAPSAENQLRA